MIDETETERRRLCAEIASHQQARADLESIHGQVWDTDQLSVDFEVKGFMAPFVVVRRKSDGVMGSLEFQPRPRFYYSFTKESS